MLTNAYTGRSERDAVAAMGRMSVRSPEAVRGLESGGSPGAARRRVGTGRERVGIGRERAQEDLRNLDQLVEFIQGDGGKEDKKKKRNRKPKRKVVVNAEALETEVQAFNAEAREDAKGAQALEIEVGGAPKHEVKALKDVHHEGPRSNIVGGGKKVMKPVKTPNLELLDYIDQKIGVKERELECPVCLEVTSVPIFQCDESHLICSSCYPKVGRSFVKS